ncbi:MAG TPA: BolA family protein [Rhodocyclaceae bacterium]|nr:BolA family protein [Rhodocyclaceae bacterium]
MSTMELIREQLAVLDPSHVELMDDSARHAGHGAHGGIYRLVVVSPRFNGLATMARHRLVYDALRDLMGGQIHAISITARTPTEHHN